MRFIGIALDSVPCSRAGLPSGTVLAGLDGPACRRLSDEQLAELGKHIIKKVQTQMLDLSADESTAIAAPVDIDGVELGGRTSNCLVRAGLLHGTILQPCSIADLVRIPNFGARSLLELLAAVEGLPPLVDTQLHIAVPTVPPDQQRAADALWDRPWAAQVRRGDPRLGADLAALGAHAGDARDAARALTCLPATRRTERVLARVEPFIRRVDDISALDLREELRDLVGSVVREQHVHGVVARLGFGGEPAITLQEAGDLLEVTRERVRQLCGQLNKRVAEAGGVYAPRLDEALELCRRATPAHVTELETLLVREGVVDRPFSITSLNSAAKVFHREPLPLNEKLGFVSDGDPIPSASAIGVAARKLVQHWGATTVEDVLARLEMSVTDANATLMRRVLESHCEVRWLDAAQRWFWIRGARNRLLNAVLKIVSVAGSIEVAELRDGVGRHHRMQGFRPPKSVLAELCADSGLYRVEEDHVYGGPDLPDWSDVLGKNEALLVEALFDHGPVMRRADLEDVVVDEMGMARTSFYVYLTYSPILRRLAAGVFGLRGAPVTAAQVQALIAPRSRTQVLRDHGWSSDGTVWCAYRISEAAEISGVLSPPGALREVLNGRYELLAEDEEPMGTLVIEDRIWGLSSAYRRRGVEVGDYVVLVIDPRTSRAVIRIGAEDLLLQFQDVECAGRAGASGVHGPYPRLEQR